MGVREDDCKKLSHFKRVAGYRLIELPEKCCAKCKHRTGLGESRGVLICSLALLEFRTRLVQKYAVCNRFEVFSGSS